MSHPYDDVREIRVSLKRDLPPETFQSQPRQALWFIPVFAIVVALNVALVSVPMAWGWKLLLALALGQAYATSGFLAHEVLHGSMVRSRWLQDILGGLGFAPFLVAPPLWRAWHNKLHHANTGMGDRDPDSFGTLKRYDRAPSTRFVSRLAPGSGRLASYLFFFYWFTFHGQIVLWIQTKYARGFKGFKAGTSKLITLGAFAAWLTLAVTAGWPNVLFVCVVPMLLANWIMMSYIATNHFLRPQDEVNDPVANSMSLTTSPLADVLHLNFSHHMEHHLYPAMNWRKTPLVRGWLKAHAPGRYVAPGYWYAIRKLYQTPRLYLDGDTLIDPEHRDHTVDVPALNVELLARTPS